jgi:hypothetical protein
MFRHHIAASRPVLPGARRQAEVRATNSRQGTAAPESTSLLIQLNTRTTKLQTISKGNFSHEDLGS